VKLDLPCVTVRIRRGVYFCIRAEGWDPEEAPDWTKVWFFNDIDDVDGPSVSEFLAGVGEIVKEEEGGWFLEKVNFWLLREIGEYLDEAHFIDLNNEEEDHRWEMADDACSEPKENA